MSQSPGIEYAKQEIDRRCRETARPMRGLALKTATEAVENLNDRVRMLETYPVR